MNVQIIKGEKILFNIDTTNTPYESVKDELQVINNNETVKAIELTFKEGTNLDALNEMFHSQNDNDIVIGQKIFLNE